MVLILLLGVVVIPRWVVEGDEVWYHTKGLVLILLLGIVVLLRWVVEADEVLSYQGGWSSSFCWA